MNALCFNTFNIFSIESRLGFCDGHPIVWILVWSSQFDVNFKDSFKLFSYKKSRVHTYSRIFKRCPSNRLFSLFIQLNKLDSISLSKTPSPDNTATSMIYCENADLMASPDLWNIWNQIVFFFFFDHNANLSVLKLSFINFKSTFSHLIFIRRGQHMN